MPLSGSFLYGSSLYGTAVSGAESSSGDLVVFDNFSLSDGTVIHCSDLIDSGPTRDILSGPIPRADGEFITADYFRRKSIEVRGLVLGTTAADLDDNLDELRANLRRREGNLDITRHGVTRRFIATLVNYEELIAERQRFHVTRCPFVARFECKTPFGQDVDYTVDEVMIGTSPFNHDVQNVGSIDALPVIYLVFDTATSVTAVNVQNLTTGEDIEYVGSIAAGDILKFDSETTEVTLNGDPVKFSGSLPTLDVGGNTLSITVTGSAFGAVDTIKFKNRWL